ncbi:MAG: hypothetical protein QW506_00275 [Thermoproteota archaeon]
MMERLKVMRDSELSDELMKRGVSYDDLEDVIDEACRKKLIAIDYQT